MENVGDYTQHDAHWSTRAYVDECHNEHHQHSLLLHILAGADHEVDQGEGGEEDDNIREDHETADEEGPQPGPDGSLEYIMTLVGAVVECHRPTVNGELEDREQDREEPDNDGCEHSVPFGAGPGTQGEDEDANLADVESTNQL